MSSAIWRYQLADARLHSRYRLIAIDLPGHGASPRTGSYYFDDMADALLQTITAHDLQSYILVGLSYGTNLIAEALPNITGCAGVFLAGVDVISTAYPPAEVFQPVPENYVVATADPDLRDVEAYGRMVFSTGDKALVQEFLEGYRATDPAFRATVGDIITRGLYGDEISALQTSGLPVCFVFGGDECFVRTDYLDFYPGAWGGKVHHIPGAGHFVNLEAPEAFNSLLAAFAADVFKEARA